MKNINMIEKYESFLEENNILNNTKYRDISVEGKGDILANLVTRKKTKKYIGDWKVSWIFLRLI